MKLLYVTDLHGSVWKYDKLFELAKKHKADAVINGGDMLPKSGDLHKIQLEFITTYLPNHFEQFNNVGVHYLCCLGNDDLAIYDDLFSQLISKYPFIQNIAQKKFQIFSWEFIGFNFVVDYPFRLNDRCRMDTKEYVFEGQFGTGLLSQKQGFKEIENWFVYAHSLPTIEDELEKLAMPKKMKKAIYVIHMPPSRLGLDKCSNGSQVGSKAVYNFLKKNQPLLSLHGHIHESPLMTNVWMNMLKKTVCVQPGQRTELTYVTIDLDNMKIERHKI